MKRNFSYTVSLKTDEMPQLPPSLPDPNVEDSLDTLEDKRYNFGLHLNNIEAVKAKILVALNGTRSEKVSLAKRLIDGDQKYSHLTVNRQNASQILNAINVEQDQAFTRVSYLYDRTKAIIASRNNGS